ncbi:hypothetical protein [Alteromonas sp. CYL-A6]|uniref:hypothetical protein n=1 Tax=Alteromonas nitratireducens TaxID=3390813 RepID=UPI0034C0F1A0
MFIDFHPVGHAMFFEKRTQQPLDFKSTETKRAFVSGMLIGGGGVMIIAGCLEMILG